MGKGVNDLVAEGKLPVKEWVLRDDLKRMLIYWQLFKYALECIRSSDTLKEWAQIAKDNKNKNFVDMRIVAADYQRSMNAMIMKIKGTMQPATWNAIMSTLTSEQVKEIDLLLNEITELREDAVERITQQVKDAKVRAGIPLNNPIEQKQVQEVDDLLWSCIEPAAKSRVPGESDGYDEIDVLNALKRLYQKLRPNEEDNSEQITGPDTSQRVDGAGDSSIQNGDK